MSDAEHDTGEAIRRAVLGDDYVDRAQARSSPFDAAFQEHITRTAWAAVWGRPGLDRRTRSCVTLAVLTTLGHEGELEAHLRGARTNGLSVEEIAEVLLHISVYAGVPAANAAFAIARRVFADEI